MDYGRYKVKDVCGGALDEGLEDCIDFVNMEASSCNRKNGAFVSGSYISFHGSLSLPELLEGASCEHMENSGMQLK